MSSISADLNKKGNGNAGTFHTHFVFEEVKRENTKNKRYKYSQISSYKGTLTKFDLQGSQRTNAGKPNNRTPIILNIYN